MVQLANSKGYDLVAFNKGCYNLFFVEQSSKKNGIQAITYDEIMQMEFF